MQQFQPPAPRPLRQQVKTWALLCLLIGFVCQLATLSGTLIFGLIAFALYLAAFVLVAFI